MKETVVPANKAIVPSGKLVRIAEIKQFDYEQWGKHIANANTLPSTDGSFAFNANGVINTILHVNKYLPLAHKTTQKRNSNHAFLVCDEVYAKDILINITNWYRKPENDVYASLFNIFPRPLQVYRKYSEQTN